MSALVVGGYVGLLASLDARTLATLAQGLSPLLLLPVAALLLAALRPWALTIGDGSAD